MIGIDLVDMKEFQRQLDIGGATFVRRAFGDAESVGSGASRLAGLWAAKEAIVKAASTTPWRLSDVVVVDDGSSLCGLVGDERFALTLRRQAGFVLALAVRLT